MRGRDLTNRMTQRADPGATPHDSEQPVQRHLEREHRRLRAPGPSSASSVEHRTTSEPRPHLVEGSREHREPLTQLPAHPRALRPLPGEQERQLTPGRHTTCDLSTLKHDRTMLERRPVAASEYPTSTRSPASSRARSTCPRSASSDFAETSSGAPRGGTEVPCPTVSRGSDSSGPAAAASRITCALVPLMPNDDTPARRGRSDLGPRHAARSAARPRPPTSRPAATARPRAASAAARRAASPAPS